MSESVAPHGYEEIVIQSDMGPNIVTLHSRDDGRLEITLSTPDGSESWGERLDEISTAAVSFWLAHRHPSRA